MNLTTPENRAYMIYTSGSTGKPKGVIIQQKAKINFVKFLARHLEEKPGEHICCYASFSFDASVKDLYPPLTVGATLYLVPTSIRKDMNELTQWLRDNRINGGNYTTKIGELLMTNYELPVRYVMVGGEKLESFPPLNRGRLRLLNSYGPTETTVDVTTHWVDPTKEYDIPIGRPVVNTTAYIIDAQGRLTPRGVPGELCIGGVQLAEGYYNRPELTAKMFGQCPFEKAGSRMYHTGDLCRWNEDGEIEYLGRIDNQVKLRGYRIELGEIESQIARYDGVMLACVLVKELNGVQNLCAYFTASRRVDTDDLKARLGESLTDYMVPAIYIQLDEMPMTQNGKINRRALPEPAVEAEEVVAPGTPEEQQLWEFVSRMLKTENIGVTTNLVSVGLSSIAAMRLSAQLMSSGLRLSAKDILSHPNIRELAGMVTDATPGEQLKPHEVRESYPMNESQRGMFVDWMMNPDALQYNIPSMFKFRDIDIEQLKRAIVAVAEAHPYLKCRLARQGDDVVQVRNDGEPVHFGVEYLTEEPDAAFFQARIRPFDLLREPLYRFNAYIYGSMTYLLIDIHHIIGDGSSNYVLAHELERAYRGEALEKETYTAYDRALDEIALMESERGSRAGEFFDSLVGGVDATVYPHSDVTPSKVVYGELFTDIEAGNIDAFCKKNALNPSSFFLTVFHHVLHRVTRDDSTLVYFISNGRSELALNNFFGVLVKTLPTVVSHYQGGLAQQVRTLHQQMQEAISNDFYPFTKMVERHGLKAEILYNYFVDLQTDISLGEHTDDGMAIEWDTAKTPLSITMVRGERGQYQSMLEYDATLYTKEDMETLNRAFKTFAELCVLPEYEDMNSVPMVDLQFTGDGLQFTGDEEGKQLMEMGTGETLEYDESETLVSLFRRQAEKTPDAVAVVFKNKKYTYREVDEMTDHLAAYLISKYNVQSEDAVGVMIERSELMVIYPMAIMKAGAAYMPLDFHFPAERLQYMCEDAGVHLILSDGKNVVREAMPDFKGKVMETQDFGQGNLRSAVDGLRSTVLAASQRYVVLYTSGSTGMPKGVVLEHRNMVNYCHWYVKECRLTPSDRVMAYANFGFDAHMMDIYPTLSAGASVHILPSEMRTDLMAMNKYMEENSINVTFITTQIGYLFATTIENKSLRLLTTGGEKLLPLKKPRFEMYNLYGPTETTIGPTYFKIDKDFNSSLIGRPIANVQVFVVDDTLHLVPKGVPGELLTCGAGVGRDYLNPSEKDAGKFINYAGQRCYRTGDLVRWTEEGCLEYISRLDGMVKLRGLRIELGEIEVRASMYEGMKQVAAVVKKTGGVENLCLYYTVSDGKTVERDALKTFLAETLTDYMVPTVYMQLDEMPLTPNGKIDRKRLPEPKVELEEIIAPETETEKKVFGIVCEILRTKEFGVTNNLVSLGLSLLAAMRLSVALQEKLLAQVKMADIMKKPTVRAIAALLYGGGESAVDGLQFIHSPYEHREYYPLTENQRGVYIDWEMNRTTTQYNIPGVFRFGEVEAEKLAEAVKASVEAHRYLKTRLATVDGDVMQQRHDDEPVEVTLTTLDKEPELAYFQKKVRPFDLFEDRLYRLEVISTPTYTYLFTDIHHILYDGLSTSVFMGDVFKSYKGEKLTQEEFTAYDFALYEQELANSAAMTKAENRFDSLVSEAEVLNYPDSAKPDGDAYASVSATVPAADIDTFCAANSVTPGSYMQAAFAETMKRLTRVENGLYLTISNGRGACASLISAVGMFVKTLPVVRPNVKRGELTADGLQSTADYVKALHEQLQQSYAQDFYPYTRLVERHGIHAEMMFVYQGGLFEGGNIKGIEQIQIELDTSKFPITVTVYPENNHYTVSIGYDGRRYGKKDMAILAQSVTNMATSMATSRRLTDAKTVSETEERQLLALSEGESLVYNEHETWVDMFQQHAKEQPDHTAVVDSISRMTYRELDEQSDQLASHLVSKGVQPQDFVAVKMGRVKEFVVAILGINKAGAAYVPIDPEYPEERIAYMLEDSGAKVVISEMTIDHGKLIVNQELAHNLSSINLSSSASPCYMIYTSGSTGKPKGVVLPHRALRAFLAWRIDRLGLNAESRNALHASFSFDASLDDLLCPLAAGGSVYIVPDDLRKDIDGIYQYLKDNHITGMTLTTSLGLLMLGRYHDLPLEFLMMGGEKMLPFPPTPVKVINGYGPTEFCVCSSYHVVDQQKDDDIPIGRPVPNSYTFICDADGNLMPQGAAGELCLMGAQMSMGYWNLLEKTAEVFQDCKFMPGRKMYRTGDLARYNEDGNLEYLGRIDNQVKLRGFRVELGEIENRAALFTGIRQVAAEVWNRQTLCLYYTVSDGETIERDALKAFLAETLTDYMVPTAYMQLDGMPLTPNGKVNRKALPEPEIKSSAEYIEPEGELEILFANTFANVLQLERVGALDNFFEIGGTSLNAIRVVGEVVKHGVRIVFNDLFTLKTPRALAAYVANQATEANTPLHSDASPDEESSSKPQFSTPNDISPETGHPYSDYDDLLKGNTIEAFRKGERQSLGDILLTGATGFLGMHILHELLKRYTGHIYCPIRIKGEKDPLNRLKTVYFYYFGQDLFEKLGQQVTVFPSEITQPDAFNALDNIPIKGLTVINCVANVKHFSQDNDIEMVNIESTRHLITFCKRTQARLIHVSTASIAGMSVNGYPSPDVKLTEQNFWLGQKVDGNKYIYSKFTAEDLVLDAILRKSVRAKIMRVGNLSARQTDGEFQINFNSNNNMAMLRAYALLGVAPYEIVNTTIEFSPIDEVAHAILLLSETPDPCIVFHPYSVQQHYMYEILKNFENIGLNVRFVEKEEFMQVISRAFENPALGELMRPLIAYDMNNGYEMRNIETQNNYTTEVLFRLGYSWPPKEQPYFIRNYKALQGLGYFDV